MVSIKNIKFEKNYGLTNGVLGTFYSFYYEGDSKKRYRNVPTALCGTSRKTKKLAKKWIASTYLS